MRGVIFLFLAITAVQSWNTCVDEPFCDAIRNQETFSTFYLDSSLLSYDSSTFEATISNDDSDNVLTLTISAIEGNIFRVTIDDPLNPRQAVPQALDGEPTQVEIEVTLSDDNVQIAAGDSVASVQLSPLRISIYKEDKLILIINDQNKMVYTPGNDDLAVALDFTFPSATTAYGIPLHADSFELRSTGLGGLDPYRLYNVDHCCYVNYIQDSLYGAHPVFYAHGTEGTAAVFWLNAAQTFVDINKGEDQVQSYFISESGIVDIFVLTGPTFSTAISQYISLTGKAPLPQAFALGYHQSRWSYLTQDDAEEVVQELDNGDFPFDAIWFDVDYMDEKRSFTWNYSAFPDPVGMQEYINSTGRKVILIIDPHYKVEEGYYVYDVAAANGYFVKYANGSDFQAEGWPELSSWWDFIDPEAAEYYSTLYSMESFANTTDIVYVWNDMNEPEIFDGFERSWTRSLVYHTGATIPNTDVHNIYGLCQVRSTYNGFLARYENKKRPFLLSRSHFSGSQRYTATWTGDNNSTWDHLQISYPMCLSMSVVGMSFCGADVGGFAGNLTDELYQRWYQAGAWLPFFRAHTNQYYERREPYLYAEDVQVRIRNALRQRYSHLPLWYTLFYEQERSGEPVVRPLVYHYPTDANTFSIDEAFLVGSDVLVQPVSEEGAETVSIYLPGGEDELWYDIDNNEVHSGTGYITVDVTLDSVPVYYRGGSIISRKDTPRSSSVAMTSDPYTIYVFLNSNSEASGTLYIDDYESFEYRNSVYNYYRLESTGSDLTVSKIDEDADYPDGALVIESIVVYGGSADVKGARVGDNTYSVTYGKDNAYFRIDNLNLIVNMNQNSRINFV
ncbi:Glycosyl hydrolases family 31 [Popillia japonica]|uniref:Glucosidase II subunit alpha n=1 Tax=Popillia japonica TaxID=7064 RepID=A0AAW1I652_POPJA